MLNPATIARRPAPVREQVVEILRNGIISGQLAPGERLVERKLVGLIGASRTTVREALRSLEAERLVRVVPGKGPAVATVTPAGVAELYEVRAVLEALAARLFAERASDSTVTDLEAAFREFERACKTRNLADMMTAKDRFYHIMFTECGNSTLSDMLLSINARVARLRLFSLAQPGRAEKSPQEVRAVLDAIRRRDLDGADSASQEHVRNAAAVVQAALQTS